LDSGILEFIYPVNPVNSVKRIKSASFAQSVVLVLDMQCPAIFFDLQKNKKSRKNFFSLSGQHLQSPNTKKHKKNNS
jgi:hypothetical protein